MSKSSRNPFLYSPFYVAGFLAVILNLFACNTTEYLQKSSDDLSHNFHREIGQYALSISIVKDGELVYSNAYGQLKLDDTLSVSPESSLFRIASISKSMTSTLLMMLQNNGAIHADSSIYTYLPEYPKKKYDFTIRQLGSHTAGVRTYKGMEFSSNKNYNSVADAIEIFKNDSLMFAPGTDYLYSSYGWNLLSFVAEKAAGHNFRTLMYDSVFTTFDLNHTYFNEKQATDRLKNRTDYLVYREAQVISKRGSLLHEREVDLSNKWAGGGFESTSNDVAWFIYETFNSGKIPQKILAQYTSKTKLNNSSTVDYGIGWSVKEDSKGDLYIGHAGSGVGGKAMMLYYPEHKLSIAVLANVSNINLGPLYSELAEIWKN